MGREGLVVNTLIYGGVSAILGGIMTALYSFFNRIWADRGYSAESDGLSVWSFALLAVAGALITLIGGRRMRMRIASVNAEVVVTTDRGSVSMRGFTDSGNLLTDPLCGRAVILCELDAVRPVFAEELCAVAHREYTTAYAEGNNSQTVNYQDSQSKGEYTYIADVVQPTEPQAGYIFAQMRNRFKVGEELEVLSPTRHFKKTFTVTEAYTSTGERVDDCKLVCETYKLACPYPLQAGDFLRRKTDGLTVKTKE
jgi:hypothetical protein